MRHFKSTLLTGRCDILSHDNGKYGILPHDGGRCGILPHDDGRCGILPHDDGRCDILLHKNKGICLNLPIIYWFNILILFTTLYCHHTMAQEYLVESKQDYAKIASQLQAGDTVVLKNGVWHDFEMLFKGKGTQNAPITLTAQDKGQVILSGQSNLRLAGEYLVVSGLVFKNGYTPSGAVIAFRQNKQTLANHSRVTEVVIDNYNNPDKRESDYWVALHGKHNRFDHSHLVGKRNKGVTVAVRLNDQRSQQNYHRIDHNYFGYRPTFGSNGGETLRIGTSHYSLTDSFTTVENNYFEQTNGEVEIISIKSGKNVVRGNLFYEARGTLTMRHGNGNLIEENVFFGNGVEHTGGIRVINKDHIIRNNYLQGLTGYRFGSGFTVMNGVPNSPINRYHQVENTAIENNSFINLKHIQLGAGSDSERSAVPINSKMQNNLIYNQDGQQPFTAFDDTSGIKFAGNIANTQVLEQLSYGIKQQNISLQQLSNGLLSPSTPLSAGAKANLTVLNKQDTGVAWYAKTPAVIEFDSGKTHTVTNTDSLLSTIDAANAGDVILLTAGQYDIPKLVKIDKTLTIKAKAPNKAQDKVTITFERSTLFEIHDGGSLKLDGLIISGANSPDYSGNSVIRSKKWGMVENYRFIMQNSVVKDLAVNHSFHFFVTGKVAFADEIVLINNQFSNITGDLLQLDAEIEDLGVYNAEYVTLKNNRISDVKGAVVKLYRGGSDESTFGPHLLITNNQLTNVGLGKRNKSQSSLYLHGVQVTNITNNTINHSAPFKVEHTVGEPQTNITDNTFNAVESQIKAPQPNLVLIADDIKQMRAALNEKGRFSQKYQSVKAKLDQQMTQPILVPVPKDAGGGYSHEQHKNNYQLMLNAGVIYQLSQQVKYADLVKNMLLEYAALYPTLGLHPKRKVKSQNPGKLFWQSLNEAVWLVHTIQAYDLIRSALSASEMTQIEQQLLKPVALFLSEGQPSTFNKIHNHGTWATAAVGMAGYVLNQPEWVEKALYDLDKSGKGGFLAQLDALFSPQGYYNEGPYYQRYALMPFITFAKAINNNQPQRKIFDYRQGILLKAIDTTIQLSYNGLFFPINDAIKTKGIDTIELVHGVTIAYGLTKDPSYLDIAQQQDQVILSGDGLQVAKALDANLTKPYEFNSVAFGDGSDGKQGALAIMRNQTQGSNANLSQTLLFKPTAQGLGHGHFDKLTWQFYDYGNEIVSDYGAARFLNVEAKYGGRYLPENQSYAKQTVAHNTVVVDQTSHFNAKVKVGNQNPATLNWFEANQFGSIASGEINTAYKDVALERTLALIKLPAIDTAIALDMFKVKAKQQHQYDLPLHYHGQLIDTNFKLATNTKQLRPLGDDNGYQHLWLKAQATPKSGLAQVTWLNDNGRFYTQTSLVKGDETFLFTQLGANDANFNLRNEHGFIRRVTDKKQHQFISILEPHGEYNPSKEYTLAAKSQVTNIQFEQSGDIELITLDIASKRYLIAINKVSNQPQAQSFKFNNKSYSLNGRLGVYLLSFKR